jgi:hypothetical protein
VLLQWRRTRADARITLTNSPELEIRMDARVILTGLSELTVGSSSDRIIQDRLARLANTEQELRSASWVANMEQHSVNTENRVT